MLILFLCKQSNMKISLGFLLLVLTSIKGDFPDQRLLHDLFKDYCEEARPLTAGDDVLDVQMNLHLLRLVNFKNSVFSIDVWRFMTWKDKRLTWDPTKYDNITVTTSYPSHVWMPDVVLYNSFHYDMHHGPYPLVIHSDGRVVFVPHERFDTNCDPTIDDKTGEITCTLTFGSWTQSGDHLHLNDTSSSISSNDYVEGREWHYVKSNVQVVSMKYDCCPEEYINVKYNITFQHKYRDC